ncbi:WYL domain-containing protein [Chloroflexota bacterium]
MARPNQPELASAPSPLCRSRELDHAFVGRGPDTGSSPASNAGAITPHRQVEPYRLEWRSDTPYLVGFCHLAQAERVFRVDRIYAVVKVPADSESDKDWG